VGGAAAFARAVGADTILKMHNDERAAVGSPALTWSDSLAADAKNWADHLVTLNQGKPIDKLTQSDLVHSSVAGENLAQGGVWGTGPVSPPSTNSLVQGWVNEKPWRGGPCAGDCDHYTQMVWKNTKEVGCAIATSNEKASNGDSGLVAYLVCRYSPPGNMRGETPY
jgi:uncharacterized protein YkwD